MRKCCQTQGRHTKKKCGEPSTLFTDTPGGKTNIFPTCNENRASGLGSGITLNQYWTTEKGGKEKDSGTLPVKKPVSKAGCWERPSSSQSSLSSGNQRLKELRGNGQHTTLPLLNTQPQITSLGELTSLGAKINKNKHSSYAKAIRGKKEREAFGQTSTFTSMFPLEMLLKWKESFKEKDDQNKDNYKRKMTRKVLISEGHGRDHPRAAGENLQILWKMERKLWAEHKVIFVQKPSKEE